MTIIPTFGTVKQSPTMKRCIGWGIQKERLTGKHCLRVGWERLPVVPGAKLTHLPGEARQPHNT